MNFCINCKHFFGAGHLFPCCTKYKSKTYFVDGPSYWSSYKLCEDIRKDYKKCPDYEENIMIPIIPWYIKMINFLKDLLK